MFFSLWPYVCLLCCVFSRKQVHPCPASKLSGSGWGGAGGGERRGRLSSPLSRALQSCSRELACRLLTPCSVYHFREVLCLEFLYCRIVTGSADGKVGLSILLLVFRCLFLALHRGSSNFLVRKHEASKCLYQQNSLFSVTVTSQGLTYVLQDFFCNFLSPPFSAAYLEPLEWRLSSDYPWKQQK